MITITEINKKAEALYKEYLCAVVKGECFFPHPVRSNKQVSTDFAMMQRELAEVASCSTDRKGYGYKIHYETKATRKHGVQSLPESIVFETETDFLKYLSKEEEAKRFKADLALILFQFPILQSWCAEHPLWIVEYMGEWNDLLHVCSFFCDCPRPELYIRELPIEVHTKFVEQHLKVLQSLLEVLLPFEEDSGARKDFYKRYHLKQAEPLVRFRLLDKQLQERYCGLCDISVPVSQFETLRLHCRWIFIVENQMNFLTFPPLAESMVVWGKGFQVETLKYCTWLSEAVLVYWGDMDVHGFQILSQVRTYFPEVASLMMNKETFDSFNRMKVENKVPYPPTLTNLTSDEKELYDYLRDNSLRLEQEKITYRYELEQIDKLLRK